MKEKLFITIITSMFYLNVIGQYDLTFTVDTGIRVLNGEIPEIGYDSTNDIYYLFYTENPGGSKVTTSADGLNFSSGTLQTSYAFDPRRVQLPDKNWRMYLYDNVFNQMSSAYSTDGVNFTNESGVRYIPVDNDSNSLGIYDIYSMPDNSITMLYIGDLYGLNNARKAVSLDSGLTFSRVQTNILGDSGVVFSNPGSSYVDITTIPLMGGQRRMICMRGGYGIYSFTSSDFGESYSYDTLLFDKNQIISATGYNITGMFDPSIIEMPDGRFRIYFCASWNNVSVKTYAIFSATSAYPSTTSIAPENNTIEVNTFPNPFSTHTIFRTGILLNNATLTVDNHLGQSVKQIENISGQSVIFSRNNFPGGLYLARLTQGSKVIATKKLVILDY
jgi:hypothetical protein